MKEGSREKMKNDYKIAFHLVCEEVQPMRSKQRHKSSSQIWCVCCVRVLLECPQFLEGTTKWEMNVAEGGFRREKEHKLILYLEVKVGFDKMGSIRGEMTLMPASLTLPPLHHHHHHQIQLP